MSLKKLSRRPLTPEGFRGLVDEMNATKSDRVIAIVWATMVEDALRSELARRMVPLSKTDAVALFEGFGPLSSFSAMILMGYALGLYGPKTRQDLNIIKDVRNAFAHARVNLSFNQKEVAQALQRLNAPDEWKGVKEHGDARFLFHSTCMMLLPHLGSSDKSDKPPLP